MKIEELEQKIIELPANYEKALRRQTESIVKVNELKFEIEKLQKSFVKEETTENDSSEDSDENLIALDTELEKLKLKLSESESKVELDVRLSNGKVTESHVKALVTTNQNVSDLRNRIIESKAKIKVRKAEIQRKRGELWEKRRQTRGNTDNNDLSELKSQLLEAEEKQMFVNDDVEVLDMQLNTFRMLVEISDRN